MRIFYKMKKAMLVMLVSLFCVNVAFGVELEKVYATFEAPTNTSAIWNAETNSFTWEQTSYNQIRNIGLPNGDITKYAKLVIDCELVKGENFRILFYKDSANKTLYVSKSGVTEFDLLQEAKAWGEDGIDYLKNCTEICLSGSNTSAPGEVKVKSMYLEVPNEPASEVADSLKLDVVNVLEVGKTYVLGGEAYAYHNVSFTAPTDGFLTITTSQKVGRTGLKINGATSTFTNDNGGFTKKGIAAGSVFTGTFYAPGLPAADNTYALTVSFEEGVPYEPITLTSVFPVNGGEWSAAAYYWPNLTTSYQGQPYLEFSTPINNKSAVASVKIGEKVYSPLKLYVSSQRMTLQSLPDTLKAAVAEGLIKPGDSFEVTLTGIEDKEFAANKLADQTFTYTLASTACTGINPVASTSRSELPETVVFSFDGDVKIDNAKFYFVDKGNGEKTELTGTAEGSKLTVTVAAIEGLLPKLYDIVAEGVTDVNGKAITYGETVGQLTASYGTSNGYFKPVASPANYDNVSSLKTYTFTLPANAVYDATLATDTISFTKLNEETYSWEAVEGVTPSYEIKDNVVTVTLSKEVTAAGDYRLSVPAYLFWSEGLYDKDNLTKTNCYYMPSQNITCTILPYGPTAVTPASGSTVNKLEKLVLSFDEPVDFDDEAKVIINMYQEVDTEWGYTDYAEVAVGEGSLEYDYENNNNIIVNVGCIDSLGRFTVVVPEGSIWTVANEAKKIGEWKYGYNVDPDYWDPEWVGEVGTACTQEAPYALVAGRKYGFTEMYSYATFTAEETGRIYLTAAEDSKTGTFWMSDADWTRNNNIHSTEEGGYWFGVIAGETYNLTNYGFGTRIVKVEYVDQPPYEPIAYMGVNPVDGGIYSKSVKGQYSNTKGAVEFIFTHDIDLDAAKLFVVLPSKENKEIDVTADVYPETGSAYDVKGRYAAFDLRDAMEDVKSQNALKAGDKVQIVLRNVQDAAFADNKLEGEFKVELTLAATVCTSVYPNCEYSGVDAIPSEIELQFDGDVTCTNGKGWIIDVKGGEKQEFPIEALTCEPVENWDGSIIYTATVTLPEATIELTSKKFDIQLEGLKDADGNDVVYGNEAGKFVINYYFRDDCLNYVTADPEDESNLTSFSTTKLTFAEEVHLSPSEDIEPPYFYAGEDVVTGTMAIDPADPKSVIITWDKEITKPGRYGITIDKASIYDSKFDATKEDYGVADGASYNPYFDITYYIPADVSETTVAAITPEPSVGWMATPISQLPAEVVIEFEGTVKEVVSAYSEVQIGYSEGADIPEDAFALQSRIEDNKVILTIPEEHISTVTFGNYIITVKALGEDGKPISYAFDDWGDLDMYAEVISIPYAVEKTLELTSMEPADGATVKQLDKVTLTFSENIFEVDDEYCFATLYDENFDEVAVAAVSFEGNVATLTFEPAVTAAGYYDLIIDAYMFATEEYISNSQIWTGLTIDPNYTPAVEDLAIVSATPENGATVANLTTVEFKLNKEVGYLYKSMLIPSDEGDDAAYASLTQSETDPTSYTLDFTFDGLFANGATLRKDVTYTLTLEAYASEEAWQRDGAHETVTLTYVGAAEAFQYSDVTFEGITPAEDFVITDKSQNKFVVKFSGAVDMVENLTFINMGQGATQKFESIVANDAKTEYTLTIAESVLATLRNEVYIVFAANDAEGKRVQGNNGEEENSCFAISFKTVIGVPDLTVTPNGTEELASLSTISIKCAEGLVPSWSANATLTDANGNAIALGEPEEVIAEGADQWATPTEWTIALTEKLETIGAYTLTIPAGCFNIGNTQGQVMGNKETVVVFNITQAAKDAEGINAVTVDSEVVVYNIAGVAVANGKASEVLKNLNKGIYIVNGKKFVVK